jgi:Putative auto-transporter adhesin, head GIN domain
MKKILLLTSVFTVLFLSSCRKDIDYGIVVNEERDLRNFDGVEVLGAFEVHLIQSKDFRVKVQSSEQLMPFIETNVSNGILKINMVRGYNDGSSTIIWVYAPDVYEIKLTGSGYIVTDNYHKFGDYLEVGLAGSGDIDIRGSARTTHVGLNGSGYIRLDGSGTYLSINSFGSGEVRAYDYTVNEADVKIYGSGNAFIDVFLYLDAQINGSGNIVYEGNPRVQSFGTGSGFIRRRY